MEAGKIAGEADCLVEIKDEELELNEEGNDVEVRGEEPSRVDKSPSACTSACGQKKNSSASKYNIISIKLYSNLA